MEKNIFAVNVFKVSCTEEILKRHIKDCFKINSKQRIIMPEKVNMLSSKSVKKNKVTVYNLCSVLKYFSARR